MKRECPICGDNYSSVVYTQNFNNNAIPITSSYNVVCCNGCGFIFADNIGEQALFDTYYTNLSKYEFNHIEGEAPASYKIHFEKIFDFLWATYTNIRVLDIGCSTGSMLNVFKDKGYSNLYGIDPSESCIKTMKTKYGIDGKACSIFNFDSLKKFDLIILSAVLEHIIDLNELMKKVRQLLRVGGMVFVEVPNLNRFSEFIHSPFQQFSVEHINYFNTNTLNLLFNKYFFKMLKHSEDINEITATKDPDILALYVDNISYDYTGDVSVLRYIKESEIKDTILKNSLEKRLAGVREIVVWGAGLNTQRLLPYILSNWKVRYIIDSNRLYHGKTLCGVIIKGPEELEPEVPVLISTFAYQDEIEKQIKDNKVIKCYE